MRNILLLNLYLFVSLSIFSQKKVYADFHGTRFTREVEGEFGEWKYAQKLTNNTCAPDLTYNPDLILNGRHDIAAVDYPLVGMQSQYDPDYMEYTILSAKAAGIDGFFIEWGFKDHKSQNLLLKYLPVARKYNFEIGVILCDGWLMSKTWITNVRPEISTDAQKVEYFKECMQFLIDSVYTGPTAPIVSGRPVMYLFHDGFTSAQFKEIQDAAYIYPKEYISNTETKFPQVIMRTLLSPTMVKGVYTPNSPTEQESTWIQTNKVIPTSWIPERIRSGSPCEKWNIYATQDDCLAFLQQFADHVWTANMGFASGWANPGMDNYGCGGWSSTSKLSYISRNDGETYKSMWELDVKYKNELDMVYIGSWCDYTEGHEIEPTVNNGFRELYTTLKYASLFKEKTSYDDSGVELPLKLFKYRKAGALYQKCGLNCENLNEVLNEVAYSISKAKYAEAIQLFQNAQGLIDILDAQIEKTTYHIDASDYSVYGTLNNDKAYMLSSGSRTSITLNSGIVDLLQSNYYEGFINFDYYDATTWGGKLSIVTGTDREPSSTFKYAAQITHKGDGQWKSGTVQLYKGNIKYRCQAGNSDISFYDTSSEGFIKNMSFDFTVYTLKTNASINNHSRDKKCSFYTNGKKIYADSCWLPLQITCYNMEGNAVFKTTMDKTTCDMSFLPQGVYILSANNSSHPGCTKVISL